MPPLHHGDRTLDLVAGRTVFDYADNLRVRVPTSCGRSGECHECIVEIKRGMQALSPPSESEAFLRGSYRLACQAAVTDVDADVEFAVLRRQPRILTHSVHRDVDPDPAAERRGGDVYLNGRRVDSYRGRIHGLAIDVGTTTVVMNLVDLETGEVLQTSSFENPQRFGGSDIMHRISYDGGEFTGELRQVALSALNFEIGHVCRRARSHRRQIYDVVIVGNATMRDMLFGLDVQTIGEKPYKSLTELEMDDGLRQTTALQVTASELGLRVFPEANVYAPPLVGCHVGADVTADLLAVGMDETDETIMLVDVGTNTEVVVGNRHRMMAASCPAGPAFEGGQITYGMPGYDGAVESVVLENGTARVTTIGGAEPQGICGSGLVDLIAELRRTGAMNELGVFADGAGEFFFAPEQGHVAVARGHQRAGPGQVRQLLRPEDRAEAARAPARRHLEAVPGWRLRQLRQRLQRGQHRLHRGHAARQGGEGRQRRPRGRDDHARVPPDADRRRGAGPAHRARRARDDPGLLRYIRGRLHVQADGGRPRLAPFTSRRGYNGERDVLRRCVLAGSTS